MKEVLSAHLYSTKWSIKQSFEGRWEYSGTGQVRIVKILRLVNRVELVSLETEEL